MKIIVATAIFVFSISSYAGTAKTACVQQNRSAIKNAFGAIEVVAGREFKEQVLRLIDDRAGSTCNIIDQESDVFGIPGSMPMVYQIGKNFENFEVSILTDVEGGDTWIKILKI